VHKQNLPSDSRDWQPCADLCQCYLQPLLTASELRLLFWLPSGMLSSIRLPATVAMTIMPAELKSSAVLTHLVLSSWPCWPGSSTCRGCWSLSGGRNRCLLQPWVKECT